MMNLAKPYTVSFHMENEYSLKCNILTQIVLSHAEKL